MAIQKAPNAILESATGRWRSFERESHRNHRNDRDRNRHGIGHQIQIGHMRKRKLSDDPRTHSCLAFCLCRSNRAPQTIRTTTRPDSCLEHDHTHKRKASLESFDCHQPEYRMVLDNCSPDTRCTKTITQLHGTIQSKE